MPDEVADLNRRSADADALKTVVIPYGLAHPDDWGGAWIDQAHGGIFIAQFSGQFELHRQALLRLVSPSAKFEVRLVRWSLQYLTAQAARLDRTDAWFLTIPAYLEGYGPDVGANRVSIRISSVDPDAESLILAHFGWTTDLAEVDSDGTGARLLPRGALVTTVRDANGHPLPHLRCVAKADLPGAWDSYGVLPMTDSRGRCSFDSMPATGYWIEIQRVLPGGGFAVLGAGRAVVVAKTTTQVTVTIK